MGKSTLLTDQDLEDLQFGYYLAGWLSSADDWNADSFELPEGKTLKEVLFDQFIEFERTLEAEAAVPEGEAPVQGLRDLRQEETASQDVPLEGDRQLVLPCWLPQVIYMVVDKTTSIIHLYTLSLDEARDWIERKPEWFGWRYVIQIKKEM